MKKRILRRILLLAVTLFLCSGCISGTAEGGTANGEPSDYETYSLEVWTSEGRTPIRREKTLEEFLANHYIPTITAEPGDQELFLINYKGGYFSNINYNTYFYQFEEDGFHRCKDSNGKSIKDLSGLEPGDYLMEITIFAGVFDVIYTYDCYIHVIIPGAETVSSWPMTTPTPPPAPDHVPENLRTSDGHWITPEPDFRPIPTPIPDF